MEVDKFQHGLQLVVVTQLVHLLLGRFFLGEVVNKLVDGEVVH